VSEASAATQVAEPPPPRRRRRRWLLLLLLPPVLVAAAWLYVYSAADRRLAWAVAEADRLDPHWRLADILAERAEIPDAENSALTTISVKRKMPQRWPAWDMVSPAQDPPPMQKALQELKPNQLLTPAELGEMGEEIKRAADAIVEARKLVDQPRGRFPIVYTKDWITTMLPTVQDCRTTAYVLSYDAQHRAQCGDLDGAIISCRALVNNARALGDEPMFIPQLVRMAIRSIAVGATERTLGLGEPSVDGLVPLQSALEEEAPVPLFEIALRGERGGLDQFMGTLQDGSTSIKRMQGLTKGGPSSGPKGWFAEENLLYLPGSITTNRAALLRRMTQLIEISKLPPDEQAGPLEEMKRSLRDEPLLVRELMPATEKVHAAAKRTRALLLCAAAGLAAERYRRKHGRWPEALADLKGEFLREVPLDPFDLKPLRYRKDGLGVIIYSIGQDGKDDGGERATLNTYKEEGTDVGFRLWDVDRRRQPHR
jgi:hypothetical protein